MILKKAMANMDQRISVHGETTKDTHFRELIEGLQILINKMFDIRKNYDSKLTMKRPNQ